MARVIFGNHSAKDSPRVVTQKEWLAARKELLAKEKEFAHRLPQPEGADDLKQRTEEANG